MKILNDTIGYLTFLIGHSFRLAMIIWYCIEHFNAKHERVSVHSDMTDAGFDQLMSLLVTYGQIERVGKHV